MSLSELIDDVISKENLLIIDEYISFTRNYLSFIENGLQAKIISQNENYLIILNRNGLEKIAHNSHQ